MGELWIIYCEELGENWLRFLTALHCIMISEEHILSLYSDKFKLSSQVEKLY